MHPTRPVGKLDPIQGLLDLAIARRIEAARSDFNSFNEFVGRDDRGLPLKQADIHKVWKMHLEYCWANGRHPAILAPFDHGKTVQLVVHRAAYEIGNDTDIRIKVICNADDTAKKRVTAIGKLLSHNPAYRRVFPWVIPTELSTASRKANRAVWTQHDLQVERKGFSIDPTVQARGVLTTGIGGRMDMAIFDDVIDQNNAINTPALRPKVIDTFDNVWMSRLEPGSRIIYVGTPWHTADLTHQLMDRSAWCVLRQWISEDYQRIEQEVFNPPPGYPLPFKHGDDPERPVPHRTV